jgi:hypothetical protein
MTAAAAAAAAAAAGLHQQEEVSESPTFMVINLGIRSIIDQSKIVVTQQEWQLTHSITALVIASSESQRDGLKFELEC